MTVAPTTRCTVLLPVIRPPHFLPNAIESVLAQTISEFELFVVCDGAPPETVACANEFARRDSRVKVHAFPKGARIGEAHLDTALTTASGEFVAYLEDDDLWFPNHLEELEKLLLTVDFGNTIHVTGHPDGHVESLPCDISKPYFRQRFLDEVFNRFGYSFCGHRLDAYRRLPEGWAPTPLGMYPDLHMWRKFFRVDGLTFGTRMVITAVALPGYLRGHMSFEERVHEASDWISRIADELQRSTIVEAAWGSMVSMEIQRDLDIRSVNVSNSKLKSALAKMEEMHPGSLKQLEQEIELQADAQLEVERLTAELAVARDAFSLLPAKSDEQELTIAALQAELADLNGQIAELTSRYERVVYSKSWRLTQPLRSAVAVVRQFGQQLHHGNSHGG